MSYLHLIVKYGFFFTTCFSYANNASAIVDIVPDSKFEHGFSMVKSPGNAPVKNYMSPLLLPGDKTPPSWALTQFWSQEGLTGPGSVSGNCKRRWINKYKGVSLGCSNGGQIYDLALGFNTLSEYNNTFKVFDPDQYGKYHWPDNPKWVHFGISAAPKGAPTLDKMNKLVLTMKAKLFGAQIFTSKNCSEPKCHSLENYDQIKSKLHIGVGFFIRNMNKNSPYYMQGVTVGVHMYDSSERMSKALKIVDPVMGVLIYRLDQGTFTNGQSLHDGKEVAFFGDLYKGVKDSIAFACNNPIPKTATHYFFGSCNLADYAITQVLINWELLGLGTATIGVRDFHLYMTPN